MQRLAHPHAQIEFSAQGPAEGTCDASRVREALGNFVSNAVKHGDAGATITVNVNGTANGVAISVENPGELDPESIDDLFEPLRRGRHGQGADRAHLGLGLLIARQIARAHHGDATGHCKKHRAWYLMHSGLVHSTHSTGHFAPAFFSQESRARRLATLSSLPVSMLPALPPFAPAAAAHWSK
ncbi:sensor histidine kinase [Paracidovorax cattleyae]|uniref:histidine kinase n=1 Tax=Paracidovorax cattleyae TaxID=80868 RepID=A0A1H0VW67_9BURK|nr:ATP-binding protein [Paracidovorax cattleyae]SDP82405.1 Histidine kinase-, DNA gyrase B-, and HSP90-like ATPase [Paracidovorax cattleyae]